jgi:hypothetical protein
MSLEEVQDLVDAQPLKYSESGFEEEEEEEEEEVRPGSPGGTGASSQETTSQVESMSMPSKRAHDKE